MGSVGAQLQTRFGHSPDDAARSARLAGAFSATLPFGFVGMPLIGWLLDTRPLSASFLLVDLAGCAYGALVLLRSDWALRVCFALVSLSQQFLYSAYFAAVAKLFGFCNFGKLSALINLLVAALGCAQYALGALALTHGYEAVDLALLACALPLLAFSLAQACTAPSRGAPARETVAGAPKGTAGAPDVV